MATINYGQLANDGFSLSEGDLIRIHGIEYQVSRSDITGKYYLNNTAGNNDEVFHKLRLGDSKYALARTYEPDVDNSGCFPEFKNLNNLTKFVVWLVKTPLFKEGDKVKISKFKGGETYPFGFNDGMQKHSGDVATISSVNDGLKNHSYCLKGICYTWSENQLELVSVAEAVACHGKERIKSLAVDETVMVGGKECVVFSDKDRGAYWISLRGELEQAIYDNLGITYEQKLKLAEKYHATELITASPEFGSLEDLTDFVNALNSGEWKNPVNPDKEEKPKKDITYRDLIDGYVLKVNDTLTLAGIHYKVSWRPFLHAFTENNGKIFDVLGIKDKDAFGEKFGKLADRGCSFPEFETYEGLTNCVIELMERAEYIPVSPELFGVSVDYGSGSSAPIIVASAPRPSSTTDTGIVRLPEIKDDFKIIIL